MLLDKAESELKRAGIESEILQPGWQRIALPRKLTEVRSATARAPLSPETWSVVEPLIKDIGALPHGSLLAESGNQGLQALKGAHEYVLNNQFTKARERVALAERQLSPLGTSALPRAQARIDEAEAEFDTARREKIGSLLRIAEKQLQKTPLTAEGLRHASATFGEVLKLDDGQSKALAGRALSTKLINTFTAMDESDFHRAQQSLASAQKIATNAGIAPDSVTLARDRLAKTQHVWTIANNRAEVRQLFSDVIKHLSGAPLDRRAITHAEALYQKTLAISGKEGELEAEKTAANSGVALANALARISDYLEDNAFEQARQP